MKAVLILMTVCALGLGATLLYRHNQSVRERRDFDQRATRLQQALESTRTKLDDQERIALLLQSDLRRASDELTTASNDNARAAAELKKIQSDARAAAEAAKAADEASKREIAQKQKQIGDLEKQGDDLSVKIGGMEATLGELGTQIAQTEARLAASEGDREFLLKELKRLQSEKSELEKQFNDLTLLRTQVARIKEELSIARRLEWIRASLYGPATTKRAAALLMSDAQPPPPQTNFNLNVELRQDGAVDSVPTNDTPPVPAPAPPAPPPEPPVPTPEPPAPTP